MKRTLLLTGIIAWTLVLVIIVALLVGNLQQGGWQEGGSATLLKEEHLDIPANARLVIETNSADVEIFAGEGEQIRVRQYGFTHTEDSDLFTIAASDDRVLIQIQQKWRFGFVLPQQERLEIELPADWLGNVDTKASSGHLRLNNAFIWQNVNLNCSSGNIIIEDKLTAANLSLNSSSGTIRAAAELNVAGICRADANSGNIHLDGAVTAQKLYAETTSGTIRLAECAVQEFDLRASSGNIKSTGLSGSGSARVNSGSIGIDMRQPLGNISMRASSGTITLHLPQDLSFDFTGRCSSGSVKADFPLMQDTSGKYFSGSVGNNPDISINAEVNSGRININSQ